MMHEAILLAAEGFLSVLCAVLGYSVITRKLVIAWPIHVGVALFTIAALGALDAILADRPFLDSHAVAARWLLVVAGVAIIVGCFLWRVLGPVPPSGPRRRARDFVALSQVAPLTDAPRGPRRRWPWRRRR